MRVQFREIDLATKLASRTDGFVEKYAVLCFAVLAVFCYGLLLPTDWVALPLFAPVRWAALSVPVVGNYAEASPIPGFVRGFLGLAVYLPPFFGLYFFSKRNIERTEPGLITVFTSSPESPVHSGTPTLTAFMNRHPLCRAAFGLLVMSAVLLVFYVGVPADQLEQSCARGGRDGSEYCLILFLLQNRFLLSLFGALFTPMVGLFVYIWLDFAVQFWVALTGADVPPPSATWGRP